LNLSHSPPLSVTAHVGKSAKLIKFKKNTTCSIFQLPTGVSNHDKILKIFVFLYIYTFPTCLVRLRILFNFRPTNSTYKATSYPNVQIIM
jgi:hypothetical protein